MLCRFIETRTPAMTSLMRATDLIQPTEAGLYCPPANVFIDPVRPVEHALITHGHSDHARSGHRHVLATAETLRIMAVRYGENFADARQIAVLREPIRRDDVTFRFHPAGHVLGSAQIEIEYKGFRIVVSGDYKCAADPTCTAFEPVRCNLFITEATFGLPVFRHPPLADEVAKLLASLALFPDRSHLVGAYSLGKAQRVIALIRAAGYDAPIYLHGALDRLTRLYEAHGIPLGVLKPIAGVAKPDLRGAIILCPPSALQDVWSRRFDDPVTAFASGWMRIRARARQRGVELPLVISDHADWAELQTTILATGASEIWVTHGQEDALVHWCRSQGLRADALRLIGYEDDGEAPTTEGGSAA